MLKTVDETCDFIAKWCGEDAAFAGEPLNIPLDIPDVIMRLNARLGEFWSVAHPLGAASEYSSPLLGALEGQDRILDPRAYARDGSGIVPFIRENQDVWRYGFNPDDVDQLLVSGDWCAGSSAEFEAEWRLVPAKVEDAIMCTLLNNVCMLSKADWDDDEPKPEAAHLILWRHPAWRGFDGFWTNEERTLIWFSGWRITRR